MLNVLNSISAFNDRLYRNTIGLKLGFNPFDDLSDNPEDWEEAENAVHYVQRFNSSDLQHNAIDYVFSLRTWEPSRFSDGSFPVWYGSVDLNTTFYETAYHWKKFLFDVPDLLKNSNEKEIKQVRTVFNVSCQALAIDLREKACDYPFLVDSENYDKTQRLGMVVHENGIPALLTKSVRHEDGVNLAIFQKNVLKNPSFFDDYVYTINAKKIGKITVTRKIDNNFMLEIS